MVRLVTWPLHGMRPRFGSGTLIVVVMTSVCSLLTAGCGDGGRRDDARTRVTTTSTARDAVRRLSTAPGPLSAGQYSTTRFRPALSFALGSGWQSLGQGRGDLFFEHADKSELAFGRLISVFNPAWVPSMGEDSMLLASPNSVADLLGRHPRLTIVKRGRTMVSGVPVTYVDAVVRHGYRWRDCSRRCVLLFAFANYVAFSANEGQRFRTYVVGADETSLIITATANANRFAQAMRRIERVLKTVRLRSAQSEPAQAGRNVTPGT